MMKNKNRNEFTKKYRYKLVENKTEIISKIVYESNIITHNTNRFVNGKKFHFIPYNYYPFWFFKIIWNLKIWYKRPKKKPVKIIKTTKTISKRLSNSVGIVLLAVIGTILSSILWTEYKNEILKLWREWTE